MLACVWHWFDWMGWDGGRGSVALPESILSKGEHTATERDNLIITYKQNHREFSIHASVASLKNFQLFWLPVEIIFSNSI